MHTMSGGNSVLMFEEWNYWNGTTTSSNNRTDRNTWQVTWPNITHPNLIIYLLFTSWEHHPLPVLVNRYTINLWLVSKISKM